MAILEVLKYGDPRLRQKAEAVHKVSAKIQKLVDDLFDTMYNMHGCGLAATQVGEMKRVFVIDCATEDNPLPAMAFINPVIVRREGSILSQEGCLSFPNVYTDVTRYQKITVRYKDIKGRNQELQVEDGSLLCRAIQHELDHLDGVLFVDHVIDRFDVDQQLKENNLPPIEAERLIVDPALDKAIVNL